MSEKNQIKTRLAQLASQDEFDNECMRAWSAYDSREPWIADPGPICPNCRFNESACDCSRYDSEGNEL